MTVTSKSPAAEAAPAKGKHECVFQRNKKLLGTSASLLETGALLVVTRTLVVTSATLLGTRSFLGGVGRKSGLVATSS